MDFLEDIWDYITEGCEYLFTGEWIGDMGDFFSEMFEGIGEFSIMGISFAIITIAISYMTRYLNLNEFGLGLIESMTQYMPMPDRIIWTVFSYAASGIAGYLIGKRFENT